MPSSAPMFTLDPMVAPKAPELSPSNTLMMLAMQFNNSTAMIGKAAHLKFAKIDSLALALDSVVEADSVDVEDLAVVSLAVGVLDLVGAEVLEAASEEVVVVSEVGMEAVPQVGVSTEVLLRQLPLIPSLITLLPVPREARLSMFEM